MHSAYLSNCTFEGSDPPAELDPPGAVDRAIVPTPLCAAPLPQPAAMRPKPASAARTPPRPALALLTRPSVAQGQEPASKGRVALATQPFGACSVGHSHDAGAAPGDEVNSVCVLE